MGLTLVLGGARSGKSRHAEELVEALPPPWSYLATGQAYDDEMVERIALHRARRGAGWVTLDAPHDLAASLRDRPAGRAVLVMESAALVEALAAHHGPIVAVSNETGLGIVPDNALARRFRDAQGRLNQMVAARADTVIFMVAGLPMKVK